MKFFKTEKIIAIWPTLVVVILALVFFVLTSSFNYFTQAEDFVKWGSPDEQANYVFTKLYAQTGELTIYEKYNIYLNDMMHPRSFRSDSGQMKPVSFLGIILIFGTIAKIFTYKIIPYLTPFIASLGLVYYYLFIKRIFGKNNALISVFLLASFPVFVYYSMRSMFHNVLFVSLLCPGFYYLMIGSRVFKKEKFISKLSWLKIKSFIFIFFSGVFFGLAIITRTSELLWLAPLLIVIWLFNIRRFGFTRLAIFLATIFLALIPMLYYNAILYNSAVNGGYPEMNASIHNIGQASGEIITSSFRGNINKISGLVKDIKDNVFHFGINTEQSAKMVYYYFYKMFGWLFALSGLGFILFIQKIKKWKKKHFVFIISYLIAAGILVLYYGSWEFFDNPDKASHTIGNSYTRYWLPIYMGAIPLASLFIIKFSRAIFPQDPIKAEPLPVPKHLGWLYYITKKHFQRPNADFLMNGSRVIITVVLMFLSINYLLIGSEEGIVYAHEKSVASQLELKKIISLTEENAVIVTQFHDKLLFPERKVMVGLFNDEAMNELYAKAVELLPVYYYNFRFNQEGLDYLNNSKLKKVGLRIEEIERVNKDFSLYRLGIFE